MTRLTPLNPRRRTRKSHLNPHIIACPHLLTLYHFLMAGPLGCANGGFCMLGVVGLAPTTLLLRAPLLQLRIRNLVDAAVPEHGALGEQAHLFTHVVHLPQLVMEFDVRVESGVICGKWLDI